MPVRKADRIDVLSLGGGCFLLSIGKRLGKSVTSVPALNGGRLWLYDATSRPIEDPRVIAALERAVRANH